MKSVIIFLGILSIGFANIVPSQTVFADETIQVEPAQNMMDYYTNLLNMSPAERESMGFSMNRVNPMNMMQGSPMDAMSNSYMNFPGMGMGYPNMMMNGMNFPNMGFYPNYAGQYQGNSCPCVPSCPPCMPWFPCNPCSCPCQTNPPDNNIPDITTTETPTTTTTVLTTVTQEVTQPPNNCVPCTPCVPCGPIWWMPCGNCNCVNGCQTQAPITTTAFPTVVPIKFPPRDNISNKNNCQCICAPCPPWGECPPCPKNCPCY